MPIPFSATLTQDLRANIKKSSFISEGSPIQTDKNPKFADLHLHTSYSDGSFNPEQLLEEAQKHRFSAIAVTDHDTIEGLAHLEGLVEKCDLEVVPGVEITTSGGSSEFHILGYFIDKNNEGLLDKLGFNRNQRVERMKKIFEKLNRVGLDLHFNEFEDYLGETIMGRLNLAIFLCKKKLTRSPQEAFDKYIGPKKPGYEKGKYLSTQETIQLIRNAGGVAVWAHPGLSNVGKHFSTLLNWGIQGLEVFHPNHSAKQRENLSYLAEKYALLVTGGSDCHGANKERVLMGEVKLPYSYIEMLRDAATPHAAKSAVY